MSDDLVTKVTEEISRIQQLELAEQADAFAVLRDQLEAALEQAQGAQNSNVTE